MLNEMLAKNEKVTGMILIKTRKFYSVIDYGNNELWFGRPIDRKKLRGWINDLINWAVYEIQESKLIVSM
jgi:hypothetical protein